MIIYSGIISMLTLPVKFSLYLMKAVLLIAFKTNEDETN